MNTDPTNPTSDESIAWAILLALLGFGSGLNRMTSKKPDIELVFPEDDDDLQEAESQLNDQGRVEPDDDDLNDVVLGVIEIGFIAHGYDFSAHDVTLKCREKDPLTEFDHGKVKEIVHSYMEERINGGLDYRKEYHPYIKYVFSPEDEVEDDKVDPDISIGLDPLTAKTTVAVAPSPVVSTPWSGKARAYAQRKLNRFGKVTFRQVQNAMSPLVPSRKEVADLLRKEFVDTANSRYKESANGIFLQ